MGEASRIVSAVERNRVRYSGPTPEELAPTSVLEAREREELAAEELVSNGPAVQHAAVAPEGNFPMVVDEIGVPTVIPEVERAEVLSKVSSVVDGSAEVDTVLPMGVSGKQVSSGECSKGGDNASSRISVDVDAVDEVIGHSKEKLTKEKKGKGVIDHSSQDEISFRHALPKTFDPIIKAQKAKTWKRLNSASGRGSKGGSKPSSFPISPKLSHVMVANAKYKLSPKVSVKSFSVVHIDALVQCPDKCSLADMGFEGQCFTWINKRQGAAHVQERLDRFCCNQEWHNLFPSGSVITGDFIHSDHRPVVATLENVVRVQKNDKSRGFRFETHWLKDEECHEIVNQTWLVPDGPLESQDSIIDIFGRLGPWNKGKFGSIPRLVRETQKQLDDLLSVAAPLVRMEEVKRLETKLNDLLSWEECYWKLRSRADWLAMGDRNTKYFHNKATGRKKKNAIVEIMTEDGRKLSVEEDIVGEIERYFGKIFSSASPTVQQVENGIANIDTQITPEESAMLETPFYV
ncbi:hypothetical protein G4B88_012442 [Cannabis sativa]|uniref:Uncharacterized protein n=1 Tax=Cannabis sativa TaxID=3483 RepID=A0A7J6I515_CANSA|nr:hypothetical protein G4B88_012442 [Cannabis sativa]